jgi:hypothetical protein
LVLELDASQRVSDGDTFPTITVIGVDRDGNTVPSEGLGEVELKGARSEIHGLRRARVGASIGSSSTRTRGGGGGDASASAGRIEFRELLVKAAGVTTDIDITLTAHLVSDQVQYLHSACCYARVLWFSFSAFAVVMEACILT